MSSHDHDDTHSHFDSPLSRRRRSEMELRAMALEAALVENGLVATDAIDEMVEYMEQRIGPHHGARVVARAWTDPEFKQRLLDDGTAAIAELGISGPEGNVRVVENTADVHNLVVCTLCSCYPWPLLGLPPIWYKSFAYRRGQLPEPRTVLREFGVELPAEVEISVWDSSAEVRYLVLPQRPSDTDDLTDDELAGLVTRDSMIGTGVLQ